MERLNSLTSNFRSNDMGNAAMRSISSLAALVQREANALAYIDGFWLTFWAAVVGLVLVSLLKAPPPGPLTPAQRRSRKDPLTDTQLRAPTSCRRGQRDEHAVTGLC